MTALIGGPLAALHEPSPAALDLRVRQTLRCLLEGDSDRQIASRLRIVRDTVNRRKKAIFAHFGVAGRAELLARWIRRGWTFPLGPSDQGKAELPLDMPTWPPLTAALAKEIILSPGELFEHSSQIYMVYLIRLIFQQHGDEGAILPCRYLARELTRRFGLEEYSDKTVLNYIEGVQKLFRQHFRNRALKLFESIHSRGLSVVRHLAWNKDIETAWNMIKQVGRMMDGFMSRNSEIDSW